MLVWAEAILSAHAERKSVLEVEYVGEEGTGLGPSLEFYALVASELQQRSLAMWLCDDDFPDDQAREVGSCEERKIWFSGSQSLLSVLSDVVLTLIVLEQLHQVLYMFHAICGLCLATHCSKCSRGLL